MTNAETFCPTCGTEGHFNEADCPQCVAWWDDNMLPSGLELAWNSLLHEIALALGIYKILDWLTALTKRR